MPGPSKSKAKALLEGVIAKHGETVNRGAESQAMAQRLDKVELLIEEMGRQAALVSNFNDYVLELKKDVKSLRRTRNTIISLALLFVLLINVATGFMLYGFGIWFWIQDTYLKVAIIVSTITASVVLLSIILKGAFHSLSDRNKDDTMPPQVREALDALKLFKS